MKGFEIRKFADYDPDTKVSRWEIQSRAAGSGEWVVIGAFSSEYFMELFLAALNSGKQPWDFDEPDRDPTLEELLEGEELARAKAWERDLGFSSNGLRGQRSALDCLSYGLRPWNIGTGEPDVSSNVRRLSSRADEVTRVDL